MANSSTLSLKLSGDKDVKEMLHDVGLGMTDLRPAMQDTGKYLKGLFSGEVFASRVRSSVNHGPDCLSRTQVAKPSSIARVSS